MTDEQLAFEARINEIKEIVLSELSLVLGTSKENISLTDNPHFNLGADSLDMVELILGLELALDVQFDDQFDRDIQTMTVGEIVGAIHDKTKDKVCPPN